MNNKLTRQQAIETLRWYLDIMQVLDDKMTLDGAECTVNGLLTALDDTRVEDPERFEGFSNRETWAAVEYVRNHPILSGTIHVLEAPAFAEVVEKDFRGEAIYHIGSLWRVNWDEVAAALRGEDKP